jgi:hypothetical protein
MYWDSFRFVARDVGVRYMDGAGGISVNFVDVVFPVHLPLPLGS